MPAWFILPAYGDRARVSSATFIIVLLVSFMRSPPVSSATVPVGGPEDSPAVAALRLGLRLAAYGYGERLQTPAPASIHAAGTRIEYRRGPLTEWYVNAPQGLEQGFTLRERPEPPQGGPLEIELAVSGGLQPALVGEHIELRRDGRAVLRYTDLRAWDAAGRELAARMVVHSGRIRLEVTDRGALYPVTVDPWIQQQVLTAADGARDDVFGYAVAVSGKTAIIGAIGNNSSRGAAYVFTCSGIPCTWTQQQELTAGDGAHGDEFGYSVAVSGNTAIIGAAYKNSYQGAAYVFNSPAVAISGPPTPPPPP